LDTNCQIQTNEKITVIPKNLQGQLAGAQQADTSGAKALGVCLVDEK
jgi:hypothetical protein